ncbi:MAG: hypothetical protein HY961_05600 [Ignavibacteriae bacterium]|nr:hypothetical protein [Ignavibacteriota bacterium]
MTIIEQNKRIQELRDYESKMSRTDLEEFRMFVKRMKDDESLDQLSLKKLDRLYSTYVSKKSKPTDEALKALFRKAHQ